MTREFWKGAIAMFAALSFLSLILEYGTGGATSRQEKRADRSVELQEKDLLIQQEILERLRKNP